MAGPASISVSSQDGEDHHADRDVESLDDGGGEVAHGGSLWNRVTRSLSKNRASRLGWRGESLDLGFGEETFGRPTVGRARPLGFQVGRPCRVEDFLAAPQTALDAAL